MPRISKVSKKKENATQSTYKTVATRLQLRTHDRLLILAARKGTTRSKLIARAIEEFLDREIPSTHSGRARKNIQNEQTPVAA